MKGIEIDRSANIKASEALTIPTVTARNSFRIVKVGLSEYCTASQKIISAVPPPLFRGEARYGAWLRQYRYQNDSDKA